MEIAATVPRRGDVISFCRPTFWTLSKVNHLRDFYGVGNEDGAADTAPGYSPFRTGLQHQETIKPWMGMREGNDWEVASSVMSKTVRPMTAQTDHSYPLTAATSRPRTSQPQVQIIKHVNVDNTTITEERIAMQKLMTENDELRKMCGELQRAIDHTAQTVQNVSENAKNVAQVAKQLADMQLKGGDIGQLRGDLQSWQDRLLLDDDELSIESYAAQDTGDIGHMLGAGHARVLEEQDGAPATREGAPHLPEVLRIDTTKPSTRRENEPTGEEGGSRTHGGKPSTPRGTIVRTPRGGVHTPRDHIRPGTASYTPRLLTPRTMHTPRNSKPPTPLQHAGSRGGDNQFHLPSMCAKAPGANAHKNTESRPNTANSATGSTQRGWREESRPPTAQSTASERAKRQRPIHSGRQYIALYRDGLLGQVEDFSRLVFPQNDRKQKAFLNSMMKKNEEARKASTARYAAAAEKLAKTRPLSEMVDKKSWDGISWKDPSEEDGWPGIKRQVHWEPNRGGGAGHSAPLEWSKLVMNKLGGKVYEAAVPIVGAKIREQSSS